MTDFLVRRFVRDSENTESTEVRTRYGILASVVGIFCNIFLFAAKLIIGTLMHSLAVTADAFNNLSDAASSIISFIGVKMAGKPADAEHPFGHGRIEYIAALIVSLLVIWSGFSIAKDTLEPLIGQRVPAELYQKISQMVESYDGIVGTHDLIVHNYGPNQGMATIHAEVPNDVNIEVSHAIIDRIEREVGKELNITLVIHMDPVELHDAEVLRLKEKTEHIIKALDSKLSFHDFRLVKTTPVNLIFDLLVPAEYTQKDTDRVLHQLMQLISEMEAGATCVITVDHSFEAPEE